MKNTPGLFIVVSILLVLCPFVWQANPCLAKYSGGVGTANDPYQIGSAADLLTLSADTGDYDANFILTADIDLSANSFTTAVIATDSAVPFAGDFNGNGHKISNLTINSNWAYCLGLFGTIDLTGKIENLHLANIKITGGDNSYYLGGLAGNNGGVISNCFSSGAIESGAGSGGAGGLVGDNQGDINNCSSSVAITGGYNPSFVGGLVGFNYDGNVIASFSTGDVIGGNESAYIGGLVGLNYDGNVIDSFSTGDVNCGSESTYVGGLAGLNINDNTRISSCRSAGKVIVAERSECAGGLVGENFGNISNCSSTSSVAGGRGLWDIGGLVGDNLSGGVINACSATGDVNVEYDSHYLGGLVGENGGSVSNCYSTGFANSGVGSDNLGGLVGCNNSGSISDCFSAGSVIGGDCSYEVGGLVGNNQGDVDNCYSTGTVSGGDNSYDIGGLVGDAVTGNISDCYSTGTVSSGNGASYLGGLVGLSEEGDIQNSYFLDTSGPDNGYGQLLTDAHMKQQASFADWDFVNETVNGSNDFWIISESISYPTLRVFAKYSGGAGTANDPYRIADSNDLLALAANTGDYDANFILTADIDLSPYTFTTAVLAPDINNSSAGYDGNSFTGVFDGAGHKIINLTINTGALKNSYLGLFGCVDNNGVIKNLRLENIIITGVDDYIGGLVGFNGGSINRCCSTGDVTGGDKSSNLGGLVGANRGIISSSYSTSTVTGASSIGGLVGMGFGGSISNCYSTGAVTGDDESDCLGGLVGQNSGSASISYCYSTSQVTAGINSNNIGGLVGSNSGSINNSYFLIGSLPGNNFGKPLTYLQMKQQASFTGWDFSNVWQIDESVSYPKFAWQPYTEVPGYVRVTNCVVAAGSKAGSDTIALSGEMYPTYDDLYLTNFIQIAVGSDDMDYPYVILIPTPNNESYKKTGKYSYSGTDEYDVKKSFKFDFNTHQFSLVARNINLRGLSCPMHVGVDITNYSASTSVDETIVNGPAKLIPINFLMGVRSSVRVDKLKVKYGSKAHSDILTLSGGFSAKDTDMNMAGEAVSVTLGSQTFTIPAKSFKLNKTKTKFTCLNATLNGGVGIASAAFDFKKCTFALTIKKGSVEANPYDTVTLAMQFGDFSANAEVENTLTRGCNNTKESPAVALGRNGPEKASSLVTKIPLYRP